MRILNLVGQQFGKLTVVEQCGTLSGHKLWRCSCVCGGETNTTTGRLRYGTVNSCGCLVAETNRKIRLGKANPSTTTHGATTMKKRSPEYVCWISMRQRCGDKNHSNFKNYGARGVRVCPEWQESFEVFLRDMGAKPGSGFSIDRIDTHGNYEPSNCRWAEFKTQQSNKTNNRLVTIDGKQMTARNAAAMLNIPEKTFRNRLDKFDNNLITYERLVESAKYNKDHLLMHTLAV